MLNRESFLSLSSLCKLIAAEGLSFMHGRGELGEFHKMELIFTPPAPCQGGEKLLGKQAGKNIELGANERLPWRAKKKNSLSKRSFLDEMEG